jgi:prepilin-type N-terminal cleavage/methylation domain-containing protein
MRRLNQRGVNLIELVAVLVVAGIAIPALMTMWANISWRSVGSENVADTTFYARALMEEIKSKRFDQNTNSPWTSPASLGSDAGENRADSRTFNDVDDYNNTNDLNITVPAPGYARWASVDYVYLNATNGWQACGSVPCGTVSLCTGCSECCYKRITVNVRRTDRMPGELNLTAIVAGN